MTQQIVTCRYCKKKIDKSKAYKATQRTYYCNRECYDKELARRKPKDKAPVDEDRLEYTDKIQAIYLENGYNKKDIPWKMLMSQTKNILQEHEVWSYASLTYILFYMYDILGLNLFSDASNGSILSLVSFYGDEAKKYYEQCVDIEELANDFEFSDAVIIKKSNEPKKNKKMIDIGGLA